MRHGAMAFVPFLFSGFSPAALRLTRPKLRASNPTMRQIFRSIPYFLPADPDWVRELFLEHGRAVRFAAGETLKWGGEARRLFFLTSGLCAYTLDTTESRPAILSVIAPGRAMGDLTASINNRCNIRTTALVESDVLLLEPERLTATFEAKSELASSEIANVIAKEESIIEGLTANFTRSPEERLKVFLKAAFVNAGLLPMGSGNMRTAPNGRSEIEFLEFPYALSAERMSEALNLNRVSVAKLFSKWRREGLVARRGRTLLVSPALFADLFDWIENPGAATLPDWRR